MKKPGKQNKKSGIALFMVMSAVALLSVIVTELTYSVQVNSRMAHNFVDSTRAYYVAKAAFKLSILRLIAYTKITDYVDSNKMIKQQLTPDMLDQIWGFPILFPPPIPAEAMGAEKDMINKFIKESNLSGGFGSVIEPESVKFNLNNLLVKNLPSKNAAPSPSPIPGTVGTNVNPSASPTPMIFRPLIEDTLNGALQSRKESDREFGDVYRNVFAKDIVDAIMAYLVQGSPRPNLPGYKDIEAKGAPLYSITELRLIPGIDDELFKIMDSLFTVYSTPGINVNKISKETLSAMIPELTKEEAEEVIRKRDDPDVGKAFADTKAFWDAIGSTSAGRQLAEIQKRFADGGVEIIVREQSFRITVQAKVGMATRSLQAWVVLEPDDKNTQSGKNGAQPSPTPAPNMAGQQPAQQGAAAGTSAEKKSPVHLVYWRMI